MRHAIDEPESQHTHPETQAEHPGRAGSLIVNADDWGIDALTTDRTLDCVNCRTVSSVSAMVFMQDSQRAADQALQHSVDTGLHLNLSTAFNGADVPSKLRNLQERIMGYLRRRKYARAMYHPGLAASFEYVVRAQMEEFERLYGTPPRRIDGHHHLHLCANVQRQKLLPRGVVVRRNFSFAPGQKSWSNRLYRAWQDRQLARRHILTDYFFALPPLEPQGRIDSIFGLARNAVVEVETHPANASEFQFLTTGWIVRGEMDTPIASHYTLAGPSIRPEKDNVDRKETA